MLPFWPFRKPPTRWQQLQQTLGDVAAGAGHAIHEVQDSAGEALHNVASTATGLASHLAHKTVATSADVAHNVAETAAHSAAFLKSRGTDAVETVHESASAAKKAAVKTTRVAQKKFLRGVENSADTVVDKYSDVSENVAETAAAKTARLKNSFFGGKKRVTETAENIAEATQARVENTGETVRDTSHLAHENLLKLAATITSAAMAARDNVQERASETASQAKEAAVNVKNAIPAKFSSASVDETTSRQREKLKESRQRAARRARDAADRYTGEMSYDELRAKTPKVVVDDSNSKWLWIAVGVFAGALLMMLLAPASGRRSRAALRDKAARAGKGARKLGQTAKKKVVNVEHRIEGKLHQRLNNAEDDADDITIADRVRTALGDNSITRNLDRLNVDCVDGLVTLRGPIVEQELQGQIEALVRGVRGVVDVRSDLLISDAPEDEQTFVG